MKTHDIELWFLFGSCFPCPHVSLPLVPLFIVSCFHWLLSCHAIISSVCSLVGYCHVSSLVCHVSSHVIGRFSILGSSDFASSTQECELPRTGGHKSGNSANGTAAYLITSVSSPPVIYTVLQYNEISNTLPLLFSCKHINSRKNVVRGTCMHYSETKYYIKQRCLFSVSLKT